MAKEIEYKFLLKNDDWRNYVSSSIAIRQAYIQTASKLATARVRVAGQQAWITFKNVGNGITRDEYEYQIPLNDALEMLEKLCDTKLVVKTRYSVEYGSKHWVVDVFDGRNAGLTLTEIELDSEDENFSIPPWLGDNITADHRYSNFALAINPYGEWTS